MISGDTQILMADGSMKNIEHFRMGDMIAGKNMGYSRILNTFMGMEAQYIKIKTTTGEILKCSKFHPILTENGFIPAENLDNSSKIVRENGDLTDIVELSFENENIRVYNLECEGHADEDHILIANGLCTGDFALQYKFERI